MKTVSLREVATIERHGVDPETLDPTTPYIGLEHIARGGRIVGDETLASTAVKSTKFAFTGHQVLFGKLRPNLGKIARPDFNGVCSTDILPISPSPLMDRGFLFHYLSQPAVVDYAASQATGANLPRLSPAALAEFQVPLPPLDEQRRIAATLDRADELRMMRLRTMGFFDELVESVFGRLRDHPSNRSVALPDAYWFQEGPGIRKWQFTDAGVKLLNVGNITSDGRIDLSKTERHVSNDEAYGRYKHFLVGAGDLVIASSGISFADDGLLRTRGAFVMAEHLPLCMNTSTIRFKAMPEISDLTFLRSWFSGSEFRSQITQLVTGSAQQNFGPSHLRQVSITLPGIDTQHDFAQRVRKIEEARTIAGAALNKGVELFASLQSRAFRGEL